MSKSFMERLAQQFGISTPTEEEFQSEIVSMVEEGCQQGIIRSDESEMIKNIFDLASKQAQDVMTHRRHIVGIDCEMTLKDALDFMLNDSHSRFPVYEENMDNVIGILFLKDAMRYMTQKGFADWKIRDIKGASQRSGIYSGDERSDQFISDDAVPETSDGDYCR